MKTKRGKVFYSPSDTQTLEYRIIEMEFYEELNQRLIEVQGVNNDLRQSAEAQVVVMRDSNPVS